MVNGNLLCSTHYYWCSGQSNTLCVACYLYYFSLAKLECTYKALQRFTEILTYLILFFHWGLTFLHLKLLCSRVSITVSIALTSLPWYLSSLRSCILLLEADSQQFKAGSRVCVPQKEFVPRSCQTGLKGIGKNTVWAFTLVIQSRKLLELYTL